MPQVQDAPAAGGIQAKISACAVQRRTSQPAVAPAPVVVGKSRRRGNTAFLANSAFPRLPVP